MADQIIKQQNNSVQATAAINASGELRNVRCDDNGILLIGMTAGSILIETGGIPYQVNGSATSGATAVSVALPSTSTSCMVVNRDTAETITVFLNSSAIGTSVPPESSLSGEMKVNTVEVKSSSGTVAFQILSTHNS